MGNQQATLTIEDLSWLGGVIDSDGYIGLSLRRHKGRGPTYKPAIVIANSSEDLIEECHRILSDIKVGHWITWQKPGHRKRDRKKPLGRIEIAGYKRCARFLQLMTARIRAKRDQANLLGKYAQHRIETHAGTRRKVTHGEYDEQVYEELKALKKKAAPETIRGSRHHKEDDMI